jgi:hypothetical protein
MGDPRELEWAKKPDALKESWTARIGTHMVHRVSPYTQDIDLSPFTSYPSILMDFSPLFVRPNLVSPFLVILLCLCHHVCAGDSIHILELHCTYTVHGSVRTEPNPQVLGSVLCEGGPDPYLQVQGSGISGPDLRVEPGPDLSGPARILLCTTHYTSLPHCRSAIANQPLPAANHNNNETRGRAYKGTLVFSFLFIRVTTTPTTFHVDMPLPTTASHNNDKRAGVQRYARGFFSFYPRH